MFVRVQRLKVCYDNRGYRTSLAPRADDMLSDVHLQTAAVIQLALVEQDVHMITGLPTKRI